MESAVSLRLICTTAEVLQPIVTDELIAKLRRVFPDVPSRSMSHREIDHWVGNQEVLNYLVKLREEQQSDPLNLEGVL
jgi:hypothetical protein